jgi:hypothetical protein
MKRALLTFAATALALVATLLFRGYLLREFAGQSANTLFAPWNLLEAGFVFFVSLCLLAIVSRLTRSSRYVGGSAALYFVCITWPGATWFHHPGGSVADALTTYVAVYLSEVAVALALALALLYLKIRHAKV